MHGLLILDKPSGISSARAVARVKRLLPRGTKIGHAGTLDPFATGVLLLLIGQATKLCEKLMDQPKQYEATVHFGFTTATNDPESPPIPWPFQHDHKQNDSPPVSSRALDCTLLRFKGQVMQTPPTFSALKVGGRRAYALARSGKPAVMTPRLVTIYGIEVLEYTWPMLKLRVDCGRGTYIRALARDIGADLNVGGYLCQLRRTGIGSFTSESAISLEEVSPDLLGARLIPINEVLNVVGGAK